MSNELKNVIEKLKKEKKIKDEKKQLEDKQKDNVEENLEDAPEYTEESNESREDAKDEKQSKDSEIATQLQLLHNDANFRLELIISLNQLNTTFTEINESLQKISDFVEK